MKYSFLISKLPRGESRWSWEVDSTLFKIIGADYDIHDLRVQVSVVAHKEFDYLRLSLSLDGWVQVNCDRGQELITLPITAHHEHIYSWDRYYLPPEDVEEYFSLGPREDEVDLAQAIYDYIGLAIPRRRVRPTCPDEACPSFIFSYLDIS
ncbi:MAG: YceD family protein [Bacteroidia bacterium]